MNMKEHMLAALQEQFEDWDKLLGSMNDKTISAELQPSYWSTKDVMNHLWAWQQRSIARMKGALADKEPEFPKWDPNLDPGKEDDLDKVNDWIYKAYRERSWPEVHQNWRVGFLDFLELAKKVPEKDLLDSGKYSWLNGLPLAAVIFGTYDHHQEHFEGLTTWLEEHGGPGKT